MTAAWPGTVPAYALAGSWQETPEINVAKNDMDMGVPDYRVRSQILSYDLKFTLVMTSTQYTAFLTFFNTTLLGGVLPFTYTDPRTQTTATYTFKGAPQVKAVGPYYYEVSMDVRRMP